MLGFLPLLLALLRAAVSAPSDLTAENLLLRQQLAILTRPTKPRPRLCTRDQLFWVLAAPGLDTGLPVAIPRPRRTPGPHALPRSSSPPVPPPIVKIDPSARRQHLSSLTSCATQASQWLSRAGAQSGGAVADTLLRIANVTRGNVLAERARLAESFLGRARGLLGQVTLTAREGLVIRPCKAVHTFGMAFPIDVIHLDSDGRVVKILAGLPPRRLGPLVWRSRTVVELPHGTATASGTLAGDVIQLDPTSNP